MVIRVPDDDAEPAGAEEFDDEEVNPRASALIEALRSFGYSVATSIADLADNSVTAGATEIDVQFEWDGPDSRVTMRDNGHGMSEVTLRDAMRAGSSNPLEEREPGDLGRFGLGLKTASFAQARSLTVATKQIGNETVAVRRWDLDHVAETDRWSLLKSATDASRDLLPLLSDLDHGTLVIWEKVDRIVDSLTPANDRKARETFLRTVDEVRDHLEMVFHRFIKEDGLRIRVNSQACEPWDPFLPSHRKTELQADESKDLGLPGGGTQKLTINPFVLPHNRYLTSEEHERGAGPRGWNLQQGYYLYRSRRLIVAGDWFDPGLKPEEHYKLGRVRVEITPEMDHEWDLDVRKSRARPPARLRDEFRRIARATRRRAQEVYRSKGNRSVGISTKTPVRPVWTVTVGEDQLVRYEINRQHKHVARILETATGQTKRSIKAVLNLLEQNLPVAHILSQGFTDETSLADSPEPGPDLIELTRVIFDKLCAEGNTDEAAKEILLAHQPFSDFPEIVNAFERRE